MEVESTEVHKVIILIIPSKMKFTYMKKHYKILEIYRLNTWTIFQMTNPITWENMIVMKLKKVANWYLRKGVN